MYVTVWQMESGCWRSKDASPCLQTAYPAVCVHQKERLWGVGYSWGLWLLHAVHFFFKFFIAVACYFPLCVTATLLHSALLFTVPTQLQQCVRCSCDLLVCVSVFAGDGRSRGAGLSHAAAGVLGRGVKLVGSAAVRESKYPWTHYQTFQNARLSGQLFRTPSPPSLVYWHILVHECLYKDNQNIFFLLQVFKGYVDDPRNTDNAWMETVAVNFHDDSGINNSEDLVYSSS